MAEEAKARAEAEAVFSETCSDDCETLREERDSRSLFLRGRMTADESPQDKVQWRRMTAYSCPDWASGPMWVWGDKSPKGQWVSVWKRTHWKHVGIRSLPARHERSSKAGARSRDDNIRKTTTKKFFKAKKAVKNMIAIKAMKAMKL